MDFPKDFDYWQGWSKRLALGCANSHFWPKAARTCDHITWVRPFLSTVCRTKQRNGYSLPMVGWTGSGQKSNHCQAYVQAMSSPCPTKQKYRVYPDDIQAWSTVCQAYADFHRTWTEVGPQNPRFVQALSNRLGKPHFSSLDKLWTNF